MLAVKQTGDADSVPLRYGTIILVRAHLPRPEFQSCGPVLSLEFSLIWMTNQFLCTFHSP